MVFQQLLEDIKAIYYGFHGWSVLGGFALFIVVYAFISYIGSSNTTSQQTNMGIPVSDYVGDYWASNVAKVAVSVPLTIVIIWLLLHLIKVLFHIDLVNVIKRILGDHPVSELIQKVDDGMAKTEVKTAKFLHALKEKTKSDILAYKKESFSSADLGVEEESFEYKETPSAYSSHATIYEKVDGAYNNNNNWIHKLN